MVVGPDWKGEIPDGIKKVFQSSTQFSLVAYRTQFFIPEDMPNVVKIQSGYGVKPLSEFVSQPAPSPRRPDLPRDAPLMAAKGVPSDPADRQGRLEGTGHNRGKIIR